MTPASKRFSRPEAIERAARLELRARRVVEGLMSGLHRSPYFGASLEFRQHRQYSAGDDVRHVDWKAWAKRDRLYVKQFEEDANLQCRLLVDVSASMRYGEGEQNKYEYAGSLAATIAYLALKQHDAVGCTVFDSVARKSTPPRTRRGQFFDVLRVLDGSEPEDKTDLAAVLAAAANGAPGRGLFVLVSDLFADRDQVRSGLLKLGARGHDVLVFHVLHDDELDFPFDAPTRFEGLESDARLTCNPRALRDGYLEAMQGFLDDVRKACGAARAEYVLVRTSQPLAAVLPAYLNRRMTQMQKRG